MGGLAGAWLAGVSIVAWRESKASGHMPVPAALLGVTGLFAALALIAEIVPASRPAVTMLGWGLDVALFPGASGWPVRPDPGVAVGRDPGGDG